jgi:hypothetical protein
VPTTSIDTFFACTLLVAVALIVTASFTATMQTNIDNLQGANDQNYLKTTAEKLVTSVGSPVDWGSNGVMPESFGLAKAGGEQVYELDINKVSRLNNQCSSALTYEDASRAARLYNLAFSITITQMLSINIQSTSNTTSGDLTTYNFKVSVAANLEPTSASIKCYIVTKNQVSSVSAATSSGGVGNIGFQLPNSSSGPVLLVVFARANVDERLTAYQTYSFVHLSGEQQPNQTIMSLSPLNNQLSISVNQSDTTVNKVYAVSFAHESQLAQISSGIYTIPEYLDKSTIVLIATGTSQEVSFAEWTAYPNVPLKFGSNFANTAQNTFVYTVIINDTLYKLTVTLGEIAR